MLGSTLALHQAYLGGLHIVCVCVCVCVCYDTYIEEGKDFKALLAIMCMCYDAYYIREGSIAGYHVQVL